MIVNIIQEVNDREGFLIHYNVIYFSFQATIADNKYTGNDFKLIESEI